MVAAKWIKCFPGIVLLAVVGAFAASYYLAHLVSLGPVVGWDTSGWDLLVALLWLLAVLCLPAGVIGAVLTKNWRPGVLTLVVGVAFLLGGSAGHSSGSGERWVAMETIAERSRPIINAIQAYEREHGCPPATLEVLIPKYLRKLPDTGVAAYPGYDYRADADVIVGQNPWRLSISTSAGFMSFDRMIYLPRQNYEACHLRRPWRKCGEWVYLFD
jgi:hypothetical protein